MRTDGIFKIKHVQLKNWKPGKTLTLVPFGDVHVDSPGFSIDAWEKFVARAKELIAQGPTLFIGMGDYFDSYSTSERMIMTDGRLHESSRESHETEAKGRIARFAKAIEFMRGRVIGLMGGNHFFPFCDGTTSDQKLAEAMQCDYLGACCATRLTFKDKRGSSISCDIFAHHGKGGGMTAGGRLNAVEKLEKVCDADIFLMGDNHARGCIPTGERLRLISTSNGLQIKAKPTWIGRTGSFLRSYVPGKASYVCDAALPPANLGHIEFFITVTRDRKEGADNMQLSISARQ